jgi:NAD-dependent dihydropyrimidine dehydrogenase PreA subunit
MTHIITSLCLRDSGCVDVCPVDCIVPGKPTDAWPWYYIDPDTCIDCGACVPECPFGAIFPESEVPSAYAAKGGEHQSMPAGVAGFDTVYDGKNKDGDPVHLEHTRVLVAGQTVDLTADIKANSDYFKTGTGYKALES